METVVQLVEKYVINPQDDIYDSVDAAAFASKNLYNLTNYHIRQAYIHENRYMKMKELYALVKGTDAYIAMPRKVSNQVILQVYHDWGCYYETVKKWRVSPDKFKARPGIPHYKPKQDGRAILTYEKGAINHKHLKKQGIISPSGLDLPITTDKNVAQIRIVPKKEHYVLELIYKVIVPENKSLDKNLAAGIDIGVNNLAALTSNKIGFKPKLVNGKPLKAINQYYNKVKASLQSNLTHYNRFSSPRIRALGLKRERQIENYLHTASRRIIDLLVKENIAYLVIGHNKDWKQESNMRDRGNQNFVQIPFNKLIDMLKYKGALVGIEVIITEESYTSKCSFLDNEPLCHHTEYMGRRVKRGLFRSKSGKTINADLQGSYNTIKKVFPDAFKQWDSGCPAVHPAGFIL
jgi:putative transposase